jgi:hypothetical protein
MQANEHRPEQDVTAVATLPERSNICSNSCDSLNWRHTQRFKNIAPSNSCLVYHGPLWENLWSRAFKRSSSAGLIVTAWLFLTGNKHVLQTTKNPITLRCDECERGF